MTTKHDTALDAWELVVGLEVHVELHTATKLFCGCANRFGAPPNTNVCPVCLGLPGSLPVLNGRAVEYAMRIGEALRCTVQPSVFHRKNYFYPDMPKDYQISQYDRPINSDGWLELADGTRVGITRAHLEEDTGKTTHVGETGRIHGAEHSLVDYNRAGVPLVEIVSEPDLRTPEAAQAYVRELRAILVAIDVSDAKMEEGSMRVDANVSVRRAGAPFGTRCEIKNLNSVRSLGRAIAYEARRQAELLEAGEAVHQETRHWVEGEGRTVGGRSKEESHDYRYFPEPDLVPLSPAGTWVDDVRAALPPLPADRRRALAAATGTDAASGPVALAVERGLDTLVLDAISAGADARVALTRAEQDLDVDRALPSAEAFAEVVGMQVGGVLTATQAKQVLAALQDDPSRRPADVVAERGFEAMAADALSVAIDDAIASDPAAFEKLRGGDMKVVGALVGAVMRATKGKADGKAVTSLLRERAGLA